MKIIMAGNIDNSIEIQIIKENGDWIILKGIKSDSHSPYFSTKLDEGEEENLKKWINVQ